MESFSLLKGNLIVAYLAVVGLLFVFSILSILMLHRKLKKGVTEKLEDLVTSVTDFEDRLGLIQGHAVDYMNSMNPDAAKAIYQLQRLLMTQRTVIKQVEELIQDSDSSALILADKTLTDSCRALAKVNIQSAGKDSPDWEDAAESLLQYLGTNIATASAKYRNSGLTSKRSRRRTDQNLKSARILAALKGQQL